MQSSRDRPLTGPCRWIAAGLLVAAVTAMPALVAAQATPSAVMTVRGGVAFSPSYFGSDDYDFGPEGALRLDYLRLPGGLEFGQADGASVAEGFGLRGSLRYIGSRRPTDHIGLSGTDRVDRALELGLGIGYDAEFWRTFGVVRYGVIGHGSWVADVGADALLYPAESVVVNFGPRAAWGSNRFMRTYFGVTPEEAGRSSVLDEFRPSSGLYSVGVELGARYAFSDRWGVEGAATYDRLVDDAADSPIIGTGSRDQFGIRVGITRTISLGF